MTTFTITFTNTSPGDHTVNWSMPACRPPSPSAERVGAHVRRSVNLPQGATISHLRRPTRHEVVLNVLVVELGVAKPAPPETVTIAVPTHQASTPFAAPITG